MKISLKFPLVLLCGVGLMVTSLVQAITYTPLDLDNWSTGWTIAKHGTSEIETEVRDGVDYLKIARVDASGLGGIVFWNGNDEVENGVLGNMTGSVVLRTSSGSSGYPWGVVVGAQNKTYTSNSTTNHNGYYIGVVASSDGAGRLGIFYNPLTTTSSYEVAQAVSPDSFATFTSTLSANTDYQLEFEVIGDTINAGLWTLNSGNKDTLLGSVTYSGDEVIEGYLGLMAGRLGNTSSRFFRDLTITVIPEPATMAFLCGLGLLTLAGIARQGCRKGL